MGGANSLCQANYKKRFGTKAYGFSESPQCLAVELIEATYTEISKNLGDSLRSFLLTKPLVLDTPA